MPTVARERGYRLFFYSNEGDEPAHVHVERGNKTVKFWLDPVKLAGRSRFRFHELYRIQSIVERRREEIRRAWNEHFDA